MQSNPIQQRIELICDKWEDAKIHKDCRIVRIRCQPDEGDMVDVFYTFMIGSDSPIADIAFHFDSDCNDVKAFSRMLLQELEETMDIRNNSVKDDRIEFVPVNWKADHSLKNDKNPASLFVDNFNGLAKELNLQDGLFAVAILKSGIKNKELITWLKAAVEAGLGKAVKVLIYDTTADVIFEDLSKDYYPVVRTIPINLAMPKAMEQAAAMGDPKDPATEYRQLYVKMTNAMAAQQEANAEKHGLACMEIATKNISRDPYWIIQLVVIHIALGTDKLRYKKKEEALEYAQKAFETATAAQAYFENDSAAGLLAQALMFRGTVFFIQRRWNAAGADFGDAFVIYHKQSNMALAFEASRMAGKSAMESSQKNLAAKILSEGILLGKKTDMATMLGSSYAGLIELLLQTDHLAYISHEEVDSIARPLYGPDWRNVIGNWKKMSATGAMQKQEAAAPGS